MQTKRQPGMASPRRSATTKADPQQRSIHRSAGLDNKTSSISTWRMTKEDGHEISLHSLDMSNCIFRPSAGAANLEAPMVSKALAQDSERSGRWRNTICVEQRGGLAFLAGGLFQDYCCLAKCFGRINLGPTQENKGMEGCLGWVLGPSRAQM